MPLVIVAVVVVPEVHATLVVMFAVVASLYVPVAVNCCVSPLAIDGLAGVTAIDTSVAAVTVSTSAVEVTPDRLAVDVARPDSHSGRYTGRRAAGDQLPSSSSLKSTPRWS